MKNFNSTYKLIILLLFVSFISFSGRLEAQCSKDSLNFKWSLSNNCQPISFSPVVSFGKGPYSYKWDFGDNSKGTDNTTTQPLHIYSDSTAGNVSYTVILTVTDSKNHVCSVDSAITIRPTPVLMMDTTDIYNYPTPFVHCTSQGALCNLVLKNKSKFQNSNYTIDWGDGTKFDSTNFPATLKHSYSNYNKYNVIATVPNGCISYNFFCGSNPAGGIGCPANRLSCVGVKLDFPIDSKTLQNPQGTTYQISFNDGSKDLFYDQSTIPPLVSHVYNGNISCIALAATMKMTNPCGYSTSSCSPILISTKPNPDFTYARKTSTNDCADLTQYIFKNATSPCCIKPDGTKDFGLKIKWDFQPNTYEIIKGKLDSSEITVKFNESDCYSINLNAGYTNLNCAKCGDTSITKQLCVYPSPNADFNYYNDSLSVHFNNLSSDNCIYNWDFGDGTHSSDTNITHKYGYYSTYTIRLYATNSHNCTSVIEKTIIVSINSISEQFPLLTDLLVYPNPANETINFSYNLLKSNVVRISIFNILGKEITNLFYQKQDKNKYSLSFDLKNYKPGIYIYKMDFDNQQKFGKIIIL